MNPLRHILAFRSKANPTAPSMRAQGDRANRLSRFAWRTIFRRSKLRSEWFHDSLGTKAGSMQVANASGGMSETKAGRVWEGTAGPSAPARQN